MSIKFTKLSSILLITAISSLFAMEAKAEEPTNKPISVNDTFKEAYFVHTGDNYQNSSFIGQLNTILGFKGFPDNQISADGKLMDMVYQNVIEQQSQVGSPMKTRDLSNPYTTSLQENPGYIGY
ncbi:conserved exported hypothetical protein [Hyella patelloides LEGE 07179]|uniref:Uncharacterized protein n=1 Tax=Hyella patelloides LEGE 07179 TaxID=945734 RepID=A0A563VUA8_9CYAN|nr:serine/threonine protein kinase [Hyella patelloides]VEP15030.1 conserved exported hypothetical protein [Hyella patelloides LEGE 07179]